MKKIFIVGIVASGKTTLAQRLSEVLAIPWYELDSIVHHLTETERYKRNAEEQLEVIMDINRNGMWIFEGTDRSSYRCLFDMADTIIFLDTPLRKRKIRIVTRFVKQNLGIEKCAYKPDLTMLKMMFKWTRDFEKNRSDLEARLQTHKEKLIRLYDNNDLAFVQSYQHTTG
ncbi:hypothetical protein M3223_00285 [Paenibacillus pasadenensis]|uniref:hypothetical protein n=1 Tax=Paenibacillus pasadenensis TaxID=217090 RepID=UPI00203D0BD9|nr:hypothetical protein [Paenibacillus pasadenensis]MCM3745779.1 hypothetical protein [Paenibacillus pasadenensis]